MIDPIYQLEETSQLYGEESYLSVKNLVKNKSSFSSRVDEVGIINFLQISANEVKQVDLEQVGIKSPFMLRSVYAFSSDTTNDEIQFNIYYKDNVSGTTLIATQRLTNNDMPFSFPYGATIFPDQIIEVIPRYNVKNLIIYCSPVIITFNSLVN